MKTIPLIAALAPPVLFAFGTAHAGEHCLLDEGVVFTCSVDAGKRRIEVCDHLEAVKPVVSYVYFPKGSVPDLYLQRPYDKITAQPWSGVGREEWNSLTFTNGGYSYEVYASSERSAAGETSGGVTVSKAGAIVAEKTCDAGSVRETLGDFIEKLAQNRDD